jgi:vacuolar-type H+-ATPase subunit E/Vma4
LRRRRLVQAMDFREQQRILQAVHDEKLQFQEMKWMQEQEEMKRILKAVHEEKLQFQEMRWMQAHEEIKRIFQIHEEEMVQKIERILQEKFQEMKRTLQTHEEMIQGNMIQQVGSRVANLETQYAQLTDLFVQSSMNANSGASNQMISNNSGQGDLVEEATVQQLFEAMEISEEEPVLPDQGPDDATSHNIF